MITIVSAFKAELLPFLAHYKPKDKRLLGKGSLYYSGGMPHFLRTGIGPYHAVQVLDAYLQEYRPEIIINIGLAGALDPELTVGTIAAITRSMSEESSEVAELHPLDWPLPQYTLISVKKAVFGKKRKNMLLKRGARLVDMETYFIHRVVQQKEIPFSALKIVSDDAGPNARQQFEQNLNRLSQKLFQTIFPFIEQMQNP